MNDDNKKVVYEKPVLVKHQQLRDITLCTKS